MVNIYGDIYSLIVQYLFGGVELSSEMELITIFLSSVATIFVFAIPFIVVWKVIQLIVRVGD